MREEDNDLVIGILGGMGTNATIHLFQQYADIFPAEKEWERPRIFIDNRCTMPSRVRAYLYKERLEELIDEMTEALMNLLRSGCNRIILACNTSHIFLPYIFEKLPSLNDYIINIIDVCVEQVAVSEIKEVFVLGSEGTIDSRIYQNALEEKGISCVVPKNEEYCLIRECIEAVKQAHYTEGIEILFEQLMGEHKAVILGCTELPILYSKCKVIHAERVVFDPIELSLKKIKEENSFE